MLQIYNARWPEPGRSATSMVKTIHRAKSHGNEGLRSTRGAFCGLSVLSVRSRRRPCFYSTVILLIGIAALLPMSHLMGESPDAPIPATETDRPVDDVRSDPPETQDTPNPPEDSVEPNAPEATEEPGVHPQEGNKPPEGTPTGENGEPTETRKPTEPSPEDAPTHAKPDMNTEANAPGSPAEFVQYLSSDAFEKLLEALGWSGLLILTLVVSIWLVTYLFQKVYSRLEGLASRLATGVRFRGAELVQPQTMETILRGLLRLIHLILNIFLILYVADWIILLFPGARGSDASQLIQSLIRALVATMIFLAVFRGLRRSFELLQRSIPVLQHRFIPDLEFQNTVLLSRERILAILHSLAGALKVVALVLLVYFYLAAVFGLFEATENWASVLLDYIKRPVMASFQAFTAYLPNLFFLIIVVLVTRYSIKFAGFFFREIEKGTIQIAGFYTDWAQPTHKILAVILIAFAAIVAFPYLPGANSDAFKGISIFLGFMLSLGSSAIIANIMAGVVITYMRPFRVGDRVKIGETEGDIIEKTLLVTRIRTVKNVEITIPNGSVLASHIINYSTAIARKDTDGLILHSTVTIGYDVPYEKVHKLLISAASSVEGIKPNPEPFVLQTSLDDYYISYQVNCYTDHPERMARIYSDLHRRILDEFALAEVEIMSPHYYALRDGNSITIPGRQPQTKDPATAPESEEKSQGSI